MFDTRAKMTLNWSSEGWYRSKYVTDNIREFNMAATNYGGQISVQPFP